MSLFRFLVFAAVTAFVVGTIGLGTADGQNPWGGPPKGNRGQKTMERLRLSKLIVIAIALLIIGGLVAGVAWQSDSNSHERNRQAKGEVEDEDESRATTRAPTDSVEPETLDDDRSHEAPGGVESTDGNDDISDDDSESRIIHVLGQVVDEEMEPISGTNVRVRTVWEGGENIVDVNSGDDGSFATELAVASGAEVFANLALSAPGYRERDEWFEAGTQKSEVDVGQVQLRALGPTFTVSGHVYSGEGSPIESAVVSNRGSRSDTVSVETDENGSFEMELYRERYGKVISNGVDSAALSVNHAGFADAWKAVPIHPETDSYIVEFTLRPTSRVRVTVLDDRGDPAEGLEVWIDSTDLVESTDESGVARFEDVPVRYVHATVRAESPEPDVVVPAETIRLYWSRTWNDVTLVMQRGGYISGSVIGDDERDSFAVTVGVDVEGTTRRQYSPEVQTGLGEKFTLGPVRPGTHVLRAIRVVHPEEAFEELPGARTLFPGGATGQTRVWRMLRSVTVRPGETTDVGELVLFELVPLAVAILDSSGNPIVDAQVDAQDVTASAPARRRTRRTNEEGHISFMAQPTSAYRLRVHHAEYGTKIRDVRGDHGRVEITLSNIARVRVSTMTPDGSPFCDVPVTLYDATGASLTRSKTDARGETTFLVAPGSYWLLKGSSYRLRDPRLAQDLFVEDSGDYEVTLTIEWGATLRVLYDNGTPITGATVRVDRLGRFESDDRGYVELGYVYEPETTVSIWAAGRGHRFELSFSRSNNGVIDLYVPSPDQKMTGKLEAQIVDAYSGSPRPMVTATLHVNEQRWPSATFRAMSDSNGTIRFDDVPANVALRLTLEGDGIANRVVDLEGIVPDTTNDIGLLAVHEGKTVMLRLIHNGAPVVGALIRAQVGNDVRSYRSEANGHAEITGLPGTGTLELDVHGWGIESGKLRFDLSEIGQELEVDLQ